jgi:hypothetical protein
MGNILSNQTTERMLNAVNFVEGMAAPVQARSNRRVRTRGGGGAERPYLKIKTVTDANNYTADIITPTSATVITAGVTVKALQPDAGTLPVNTEIFADIVDDVYYIQPSVFYGS